MTPSRPLRIAVVLNAYPTLSETFIYTTLENLRTDGYEIKVYTRRRGQAPHQISGLSVRYLPREDWILPVRIAVLVVLLVRYALRSPNAARRFLLDMRVRRQTNGWSWKHAALVIYRTLPLLLADADVTYFTHGGLAVSYLEYMRTRPSVFSLRGSDINIEPLVNKAYWNGLVEAISTARGIHCVCEVIKRKAEALVGSELPKAHVIYTAVNPLFLETRRGTNTKGALPTSATGPVRIVSVGRLDWRKGFEHGLMAICELRDRGIDCHWCIVGEGPYRVALQWAIRDLALEDIVTLEGGLDQRSVRDMLVQADIYFHPAVLEGLSNSVLEAMAVGLPVVVADVCGMREAVTDGVHGYLVPPRDWRAMADALEKLCGDVSLRATMGASGAEHVQRTFTGKQQSCGFTNLFLMASEKA